MRTFIFVLAILAGYVFWFALTLYRAGPFGQTLHLTVVPALVALTLSRLIGARSLFFSSAVAWLFISLELSRRAGPAAGLRIGDWTPFYFEFLAWLPYYFIVTGALLAGTIGGVALRQLRRPT